MNDRQCSSCGGFCGRGGCKRENVDSWEQMQRMATPHDQLIAKLLDSRIPKTEREHAASREIKKLREALAEPEQEPVAWMHQPAGMSKIYSIEPIPGPDSIPLYTTPPARKSLTVEEIHLTISMIDRGEQGWLIKFARAIEQAHGIGE